MSASKSHALTLFQKEYKNLFNFIKNKVNCPELTVDLLQDLYVKLHHLSDMKELKNPKSYVISMARNLIIDNSRKPERVLETGREEHLSLVQCGHAGPEQQTIEANYIELITRALSELPEEKQDLLTLSRFQGWSNQKIAEHKGRSLSWVEKNLAASLVMCSEIMQQGSQHEQ